MVDYRKDNIVVNDLNSNTPVTTLPGDKFLPGGLISICMNHPDVLSVVAIQGETNDAGCEYIPLCRECELKHDGLKEQPTLSPV